MATRKASVTIHTCDACGTDHVQFPGEEKPLGFYGTVDERDNDGDATGIKWYADKEDCIKKAVRTAINRERENFGLPAKKPAAAKLIPKRTRTEPPAAASVERFADGTLLLDGKPVAPEAPRSYPKDDERICPGSGQGEHRRAAGSHLPCPVCGHLTIIRQDGTFRRHLKVEAVTS